MIIRIVKMTFRSEAIADFLLLFDEKKEKIRHFAGCSHLELLKDVNNKNVYFTYSYWKDELALNQYRESHLFKETWKLTKTLFSDKADAWSLIRNEIV